jgi:hypothetical protein
MVRRPNAIRIGLALFAVAAFLLPSVRANEFVSNRYGFQTMIPLGFREQHSDVSNIIVEYIESDSHGGGHPITIDIRHTGPNFNPADQTAVSNLTTQKDWTSSLETRHWKELDLPVIRQEIAVSSTQSYVNLTIIFPLKGEGVIVCVQGLKSREKEVVKVFDDSVRQFVNFKPYITVVASPLGAAEKQSLVQKLLANVLLPAATGALVIFWIARVRKAKKMAAQ